MAAIPRLSGSQGLQNRLTSRETDGDRRVMAVLLRLELSRSEIAALTVGDLHQNRGDDSVHCVSRANAAAAMIRRALHGYARTGTGSMAAVPAGQAQRAAPAHGPGRDRPWCASMLASSGSTTIRNSETSQSRYQPARPLHAECSGRL